MARTLEEEDVSPERETHNGQSQEPQHSEQRRKGSSQAEIRTSDREELIQCIKRGQRPTWVPKPNLEALCAETNAEARAEPKSTKDDGSSDGEPTPFVTAPNPPDLIPRPPSALHAGDFHAASTVTNTASYSLNNIRRFETSPQDFYSSSPPPWLRDNSYPLFPQTTSNAQNVDAIAFDHRRRSRAPSLGSSLSSSFVMRVPTSPLVHATSSPASEPSDKPITDGPQVIPDKSSRRRTVPSYTLTPLSSLVSAPTTPIPAFRREASAPYRTHQVRRSLTSFTYQPATSSHNVYPSRQRRLSYASETSPRHRSSMIGSFEESILRGRMSTPPSKPLDFVAQIGVLGKGNCSARLKCPAHVSVPFPAVFYNYPSSNNLRTLSDDSPSPYVGTIDLGKNLKPVAEPVRRKRKAETNDPDALVAEITSPANTSIGRALAAQDEGRENLSGPAHFAVGGAYRVPQQGQLQVVIKNPNKTAVKLFLIPYDLDGMQPGSKTFVRQRSFSSGPVLEKALSTDPRRTIQDPLSGKQILRYLIHLKFCCLTKGRFYLYDNVRVVFANRVPEGKEKVRNEVQLPDPKFSPFLPGASSISKPNVSDSFSSQRSSPVSGSYDNLDGLPGESLERRNEPQFASAPIPFHLSRSNLQQYDVTSQVRVGQQQPQDTEALQRNYSSGTSNRSTRPQSPEVYGFEKASTSQRGSPVPWASLGHSISRTSSPTPTASGDGLLSRRLREMSKLNTIQHDQNRRQGGS